MEDQEVILVLTQVIQGDGIFNGFVDSNNHFSEQLKSGNGVADA